MEEYSTFLKSPKPESCPQFNVILRILMVGFYLSAEIPLVYSSAPADWAEESKYSYLIHIICTQLYASNNSYSILITCTHI